MQTDNLVQKLNDILSLTLDALDEARQVENYIVEIEHDYQDLAEEVVDMEGADDSTDLY